MFTGTILFVTFTGTILLVTFTGTILFYAHNSEQYTSITAQNKLKQWMVTVFP